MENQTQKFNAWMPLQKSNDGGFVGILSDDSIDRDGEFNENLDICRSTNFSKIFEVVNEY